MVARNASYAMIGPVLDEKNHLALPGHPPRPVSAARLGRADEILSAPLRCGVSDIARSQRNFSIRQYACCWVLSGVGVYRDAEGGSWPIVPGAVFQRFPGKFHDIVVAKPLRVLYAAVPAAGLDALREIGTPTCRVPVFPAGPERGRAGRFAAAVRRLRAAPEDGLAPCLAELMALIGELHRAALPGRETPHRDAINAACRLIADDPARRWTGPEIARAVGLGHHTFRKVFAQQMGCAPLAWVLRQRLLTAQHLLEMPGRSVTAVAAEVGYDDPLAFSAIFRRHCGMSPRRWRTG